MQYYTYAHYKPNGEIFYIGKGRGVRHKSAASGRSKYWREIVEQSNGFESKILAQWETEDEALEHETFLISCFRNMGIQLVNRTTGGQRGKHAPITEETRNRMIAAQKRINNRRLHDSEWDKKIREARSNATKNRQEGYQKKAGEAFKAKLQSDPELTLKVSKNRKEANKKSVLVRHLKMEGKVRVVREMRAIGKPYKEISEATGFCLAVISNIINGKSYIGVGV